MRLLSRREFNERCVALGSFALALEAASAVASTGNLGDRSIEVRVSLRQLARVWLDAASKLDGLPPTRPTPEEPNKSGPEDNNVVEQKVS
jgi:hypothetical protein